MKARFNINAKVDYWVSNIQAKCKDAKWVRMEDSPSVKRPVCCSDKNESKKCIYKYCPKIKHENS